MQDLKYDKTISANDTSNVLTIHSEKGLNSIQYACEVTSFTSANVVVKIQNSLDGITWTDEATLTFSATGTQTGSVKDLTGFLRYSIEATDEVSLSLVSAV